MVHVVAQQVGAGAEFDECHAEGVLRIDVGTAVVGRSHAATQFAGEVGVGLVALVQPLCLLAQQVGADGCGGAEGLELEGFIVVADSLPDVLVPEAVGIVAIEGHHLAIGHGGAQLGPAGAGVEGQVETYLGGYALEGHEVLAAATVLVVELGSQHGSAVLPLQPLHLGEDLTVEALYVRKERGILIAQPAALAEHPVGNAAVAHLAMAEGTQTQDDGHVFLPTDLQEAAQIALSVPAVDALFFLDVVPEYVGGYDGDPALLHFAHLLRPLVDGDAGVVHLAHDGTDAVAVNHQTLAVPRHLGLLLSQSQPTRQGQRQEK